MKIKTIINIWFCLIFSLFLLTFICYLWNILMPESVRWLTNEDIINIEENGLSLGFMAICSIVSFILYNKGDHK